MATKFKLKIRNPELKLQIEQITGAINALEEAATAAGEGTPTVAVAAVASTGTLTMETNPTAAETIVITQGEVVETYTFKATPGEEDDPLGDFDVEIGDAVADTQAALVLVVNAQSALVSVGDFASDAAVFTAKVKGVIGDTIETEDTLTAAGDGFAAAALSGGVDAVPGTPGVDGQIMYDSTYLYVSVGVSTETESNWKKITFTS